MQDKTAIKNNENANTPSKVFREYIESLVEEIVTNNAVFNDHKKYLQRYSQEEGVDYATLEKNLTEFLETVEELKSKESKAIERFAKMLAKNCYLEENEVDKLVSTVNDFREGVRQKASVEVESDAQEESVNEAAKQSFVDDHKYVDLGLPSGTLWATCNVGATKPEEYGEYFAWGETRPKNEYTEYAYKYYDDKENVYTKYTKDDEIEILEPCDDAATTNWGNGWHIPTVEDWNELIEYTEQVWITRQNIKGIHFIASNGNSIFLPIDYHEDELIIGVHYEAYWSKSVDDFPGCAWCCAFISDNDANLEIGDRYEGLLVRPVLISNPLHI